MKLKITPTAQQIIEGKITDRVVGNIAPTEDVYQKIVDAGSDARGDFIWGQTLTIEVDRSDCVELASEMDWSLDGLRDLNVGERSAARALRKQARVCL